MEIDLRTIETVEEAAPHLAELAARGREALEELGIDGVPEDFARRFVESRLGEPETLFLVAESTPGAADLGMCLFGALVDPLSGVRLPTLLVLSVTPSLRRRGLARALVQEATRLLRRRGHERLAARVPAGDDPLVAMGERWGFIRAWEFLARDDA